jgi:chromosome partitioning protein
VRIAVFVPGKPQFEKGRRLAHVIVCGNEKGGSGKSTLSMHIAVALLKAGFKVATLDLDSRQLSLSRYIENRRIWSLKAGVSLELPTHFAIARTDGALVVANEDAESRELTERLSAVEKDHDFVVIDTPGADTFLQRLAHLMADTLVTPINDSFIDFDVLARIDPDSGEVTEISHYAQEVRNARRERRNADGGFIDWIVVRNRLGSLHSRNEQRLLKAVERLGKEIGYRVADGVTERVVFREFFPIGLTALDEFDEHVLGTAPTLSHLSARQEIRKLLEALNLPVDEMSRTRADLRKAWLENPHKPVSPSGAVVN